MKKGNLSGFMLATIVLVILVVVVLLYLQHVLNNPKVNGCEVNCMMDYISLGSSGMIENGSYCCFDRNGRTTACCP